MLITVPGVVTQNYVKNGTKNGTKNGAEADAKNGDKDGVGVSDIGHERCQER